MRKIILSTMMAFLLRKITVISFALVFVQCATVNGEYNECESKAILTTLHNEPARIEKGCYDYSGKKDSFTIVLLNQPDYITEYVSEVYPLEGVPAEFRTDGLYVLISGDILRCEKRNECTPPHPNAGKQGTNMLDLKKIKINERGECSWCDKSPVLAVLKDEPAYIKAGCFKFFGQESSFAVVLVDKPYGVYMNLIYPCGGVPENFRIDGLPVLISGTIFKYGQYGFCSPMLPNARYAPINIFELKTIKFGIR